jgi:LysR family transcriptional regulator of beta-lactamase
MERAQLPLNALRAFEASARHLNFTRAADELCVTQGAVSHQVALLERRLGVTLFRRLPRGLTLTDEGFALVPVVADSFDRIGATLDFFADGRLREVLTVGVVGTFAEGWLMRRMTRFTQTYPHIDLRLMTNNNSVDLAGEGLDLAIRFGDGAWHGVHAEQIMPAPLSPLCSPAVASRLDGPHALAGETLLRSYRIDEWPKWFEAVGLPSPPLRGPVFDSSILMGAAAKAGLGIALAPPSMFNDDLTAERLIQPFPIEIETGAYWLTRLMSRQQTQAMRDFASWVTQEVQAEGEMRLRRTPV